MSFHQSIKAVRLLYQIKLLVYYLNLFYSLILYCLQTSSKQSRKNYFNFDGSYLTQFNPVHSATTPQPLLYQHFILSMSTIRFPESQFLNAYFSKDTLSKNFLSKSRFLEMPIFLKHPWTVLKLRVSYITDHLTPNFFSSGLKESVTKKFSVTFMLIL